MCRVYHIIDSIKGGCGKTTFAIMLTEYLERKYKEKGESDLEKREHACLLDLDFVGTGMIDLFFSVDQKKEYLKDHIYLTDRIRGFQVEDQQYIYPFPICGRTINISFGDPDFKTKEKFRFSSKYNYTTVIGYGIFRSGIKSVLKKGALEQQIKGKVSSVVMDMSPGLDAYSESVKDSIFDKDYSSFLNEKDRRNYYLMVGMDSSHLCSAKDYLYEFLTGDDKRSADQIFIIFDDVLQYFARKSEDNPPAIMEEKEQYNSRIEKFYEVLKKVPEDTQKKVHFLVLNPFYQYSEVLHTLKNLSYLSEETDDNKEMFKVFFKESPFRFASLGTNAAKEHRVTEFLEIQQEEILKWLL